MKVKRFHPEVFADGSATFSQTGLRKHGPPRARPPQPAKSCGGQVGAFWPPPHGVACSTNNRNVAAWHYDHPVGFSWLEPPTSAATFQTGSHRMRLKGSLPDSSLRCAPPGKIPKSQARSAGGSGPLVCASRFWPRTKPSRRRRTKPPRTFFARRARRRFGTWSAGWALGSRPELTRAAPRTGGSATPVSAVADLTSNLTSDKWLGSGSGQMQS